MGIGMGEGVACGYRAAGEGGVDVGGVKVSARAGVVD